MCNIRTIRAYIGRFVVKRMFAPAWLVVAKLALVSVLYPFYVLAQTSDVETQFVRMDLFDLSLSELSNIEVIVPAAITKLTLDETPASITVITADDIRHAPARNVYDLIETYVPGAIWMNHEEGPHPGLRGSIANRNDKFILLVNGRNLNSKAHYGAKSELEQWDMSDIQRIEIVRGPGSVTYGPGAVAGVINIVTYTANFLEESSVSVRYVNEYDSVGFSLNHVKQNENIGIFTHVGITKTGGDDSRQFLVNSDNDADYLGSDTYPDKVPLDYFSDYQNDPQVKVHMDIDLKNDWRVWLRYTQQGSTWRGNEAKTNFSGHLLNQQSLRDRQITATAENKKELNKKLHLLSTLSFDSFDAERRGEDVRNPDPNHVQNFKSNYSEDEIFLRALFNWHVTDTFELAFGGEYSRDNFGAGWNDEDTEMILGDDGTLVNGPNAEVISPDALKPEDAIYVGDEWNTNTYSLFAEANVALNEQYKLLLSGRADKNTHSDLLFSPRLALVSNRNQRHITKLIVQRSQRMNTAGQLLIEDMNGFDTNTESLKSIEIAYTGNLSDQLVVKVSNYWNDTEVLGRNNTLDTAVPIGNLRVYGLETELQYKWSAATLGVNYSLAKQLEWHLNEGLMASGVSYADYNQPLKNSNAVMQSVGNDLNNWPNQALKFFGHIDLSSKTTLHLDGRILWDYQGAQDGLESLRQAVQGEPEQADVEQSLQAVADKNVYEMDFRLNLSLSYKVSNSFDIQMLIQNLYGSNDNKRYSYDSGNSRAAPRRVRFVEEPRTFGVRLDYRF